MQTFLVFITFSIAAGFLLKKFVWNPIFERKIKSSNTLDGNKIKCGKNDCGCH
jgi:hypothetical protein